MRRKTKTILFWSIWEAKRNLSRAESSYRRAVRKARGRGEDAEREMRKLVEDAREELNILEGQKGHMICYLGRGITLYERWIDTSCGSSDLASVTAYLEMTGDILVKHNSTLTGSATAGRAGCGGGRKDAPAEALFTSSTSSSEDDRRELYLYIESPEFTSVTSFLPNCGAEAREAVARIATACKRYPSILQQLP